MLLGMLSPFVPAPATFAANERPTLLVVTAASGTYGQAATLQATLTWTNNGGNNGGGLANVPVRFTLNNVLVGTANTDSNGMATISASLSGINVGTTNVVAANFAGATINNNTYLPSSGQNSLSVNKAPATITLGNLSHTYDGAAKAAAVTTNPTGLSGVSITYSQNGQAVTGPTNAGTYDVTASLNNANYQAPNATGELIIAKANQTINFASLPGKTYGDAAFSVSASASSGLPVSFSASGNCTVSGATVTITGAGSCTVTASQAGNSNYNAASSVAQSFNIAKASATVTLSNLNYTYDGAAHSATATTNPAGLSVGITYDGSAQAPTNAGSYAVVATINNANYQGSANETLVIARANATIKLDDLSHVYNGTAKLASAITNPSGLSNTITYSQNGQAVTSPTNAGTYDVNANITDPNYQGSASDQLIIAKANQTINFADLADKTYGNADFQVTATGGASGNPVTFTASGRCTVSGATVHITGAGSCTITANQTGNSNYNAAAAVQQTFNIFKATATITLSGLNKVYNGSANAVTASTDPAGLSVDITYAGASEVPADAGSYAVLATISDDNYQGTQTGTLVIAQASQTISFAQLGDKTYGDQPFEISSSASSGLPVSFFASGQCTVSGASVSITGAGGCVITASQAGNGNYTAADNVQRSFSIGKATATIALHDLGFTYDGQAHAAIATTVPAGLTVIITYSQNGVAVAAPTNAGSYSVNAEISDNDYSGTATDTLTINKANQTITFNALADKTYGDAAVTATASASSGLAVSFTAAGNCTVSGATVTITGAGNCTVTAAQAGNSNFNAASSVAQSFNIAKAQATVTLSNLTYTYNGSPHGAAAATTPGGLNVTLTYNGSTTVPTNAGSYPVVATVNNANYEGSATDTLIISPQGATIVLDNLSTTYDGSPKAASANTTPANLPVSITYNGSTTEPVNAGNYTVAAGITDPNYTGTANGTLVIRKAIQSITFTDISNKIFGDEDFQITATGGNSGNSVTFTATGSCTVSGASVHITGAGSCTITANQAGNGNFEAARPVPQTFSIAKKTIDVVLSSLEQTYNGTPRPVTAGTTPSGLTIGITYDGSATAPTNAGSYAVVATINDANYQGSATSTLVINKASQTINFGSLADKTYGDADFPVSATATSGLSVSFTAAGNCTISGSTVSITGAGSCTVAASQAGNGNFEAAESVPHTFGIAKAQATVLLSNLTFTYDGSTHGATVTTTPSGLQVIITYGGSTELPRNAGSYAIVATVNNANYMGSAQDTLSIARAGATITLDNLSHTYDGTIKTASANTIPAGLPNSITYTQEGEPVTDPTNAGSYQVSASVTDPNYTGLAQGNMIVAKASQTITFDQLGDKTFGDSDFGVSATSAPSGGRGSGNPVTFTAVGQCTVNINGTTVHITGAGSCTITANQAGNNNYLDAASVSRTFNIAKKTIDVALTDLSNTYDGSPHAASASTNPSVPVVITYDDETQAPTNAGSYTIVATINHANYQGSAKGTLIIAKANQTITFSALADKTYGDAAVTATASASSGNPVTFTASGLCTVSGATVTITGAGACAVTASQAGNNNYNAAPSVAQSFNIAKAQATVTLSNLSYIYNGSPQGATVGTTPSGLNVVITYNGFEDEPTNAGSYAVVATINNANYQGSANGTLIISPAGAHIALDDLQQTYNGSPRLATVNTNPAGLSVSITYSQNGQAVTSPTNAGTYDVNANITDPNYQGSASGNLVVAKANQTINFADPADKTYGNAPFSLTATGGASGNPVTFTASGQCTVSGTTVTITGAGSCTITANQAGNNNYLTADPVQRSFNIDKATATVTLGNLSYTYDGAAHGTTASTTPANLAVAITYDGVTTTLTNAGSYAVVATVNDGNYQGSANGTLVIAKASQTINFTALTNRTYGDPDFTVSSTSTPSGGTGSGKPITFSAQGACSVSGTTVHMNEAGSCTITADQDGNSNYLPANSVSRTFTVIAWRFDGFYSPTNMTPAGANVLTYNTVNAGRTVPLKFNVYKGSTQLTTTSAVKQPLKVWQFSCAGGPATEVTMTGTGATSLRYDTTSNQFIYNWQTPSTPACFKVTITTADGTVSPVAYFTTR